MIRPNFKRGPWRFQYTSAKEARNTPEARERGTDGGGASGTIYTAEGKETIAFLPHHRDPKEDDQRRATAQVLATAPEAVDMLEACLLRDDIADSELGEAIKVVLTKAGYQF